MEWLLILGVTAAVAIWALSRGGHRPAVSNDEDEAIEEEPSDEVELPIDGVLDLHTFQPREVKSLVGEYLDECQRRRVLEIRIVHGKGKGVLRRIVHSVLEARTDVAAYRLAPPDRGGWGATLVTLRQDE